MSTELTPKLRERIENTIRGLTVDAVERAGIGHLGAPMGLARPAFLLFDEHLRFDPGDPGWPLRDRFVSPPATPRCCSTRSSTCSASAPAGEIESFRQLGSLTGARSGDTPASR
jgi:transketolase